MCAWSETGGTLAGLAEISHRGGYLALTNVVNCKQSHFLPFKTPSLRILKKEELAKRLKKHVAYRLMYFIRAAQEIT